MTKLLTEEELTAEIDVITDNLLANGIAAKYFYDDKIFSLIKSQKQAAVEDCLKSVAKVDTVHLMSDVFDVMRLSDEIKSLDTSDRMRLLQEILKDESVSVTELLVAKIAKLEDFKHRAQRDIPKIAEAGLELGEKEMRKVTGIGGYTRKKTDNFKLAMVKCLVDAGGYKATTYGDQIAAADFSSIDKDWYDLAWKPSTMEDKDDQATN